MYARHWSLYGDSPIIHFGEKAKDLNQINYLSFDDLERNCDLMDVLQQSCIRSLLCTKKHFDKGNSTKYIGNTIMALAVDFTYARQMCYCGTTGTSFKKATPCSKWKYCDRCANRKRQFFHNKYAHVYACTPENCYHVTLTLADKVKFVEGNHKQIIENWDKLNDYVDLMYKHKMISGALVVEEAAFDSYYPTPIINPHVHMLCTAKHLQSFVSDDIKVEVKLINDSEHWVDRINYIFKPINFFSAYHHEYTAENGVQVNRNFRDMLEAHREVILNRNQTRAIGTFHARNKAAICESTKAIKDKKKSLQAPQKKINYSKKYMFDDFSAGFKDKLTQTVKEAADQKSRPWYKNPWVLGAGGLAGAAGLYGAGKYFNGGDNPINKYYGAGVDKYLVDPINNLFKGSPPPESPRNNPPGLAPLNADRGGVPMANAPENFYKGLGTSPTVDRLTANGRQAVQGSSPEPGTGPLPPGLHDFKGLSGSPVSAARALMDQQNNSNELAKITSAMGATKGELMGTKFEGSKLFPQNNPSLGGQAIGDARDASVIGGVSELAASGLGASASKIGLPSIGAPLKEFAGQVGKLNPVMTGAFGGSYGHELAEMTDGNKALQTFNGAGLPLAAALIGGGPAAGATLLGQHGINHILKKDNADFLNHIGTGAQYSTLNNQFTDGLKQLNDNHDAEPLRALLQNGNIPTASEGHGLTNTIKNFLSRTGAMGPGIMEAKKNGVLGLLNKPLKDIVESGKQHMPTGSGTTNMLRDAGFPVY